MKADVTAHESGRTSGEDRAGAQVASELFGNVLIGQKVFSFFAVIDSQTTGFFILQNFGYELFGNFLEKILQNEKLIFHSYVFLG